MMHRLIIPSVQLLTVYEILNRNLTNYTVNTATSRRRPHTHSKPEAVIVVETDGSTEEVYAAAEEIHLLIHPHSDSPIEIVIYETARGYVLV